MVVDLLHLRRVQKTPVNQDLVEGAIKVIPTLPGLEFTEDKRPVVKVKGSSERNLSCELTIHIEGRLPGFRIK